MQQDNRYLLNMYCMLKLTVTHAAACSTYALSLREKSDTRQDVSVIAQCIKQRQYHTLTKGGDAQGAGHACHCKAGVLAARQYDERQGGP